MKNKTHQRNFIIIFFIAILITTIGFLVDKDEAYTNIWYSVLEFSAITIAFIIALSIIYFSAYYFGRYAATVSKKR